MMRVIGDNDHDDSNTTLALDIGDIHAYIYIHIYIHTCIHRQTAGTVAVSPYTGINNFFPNLTSLVDFFT